VVSHFRSSFAKPDQDAELLQCVDLCTGSAMQGLEDYFLYSFLRETGALKWVEGWVQFRPPPYFD
jgi:hypothetical protein